VQEVMQQVGERFSEYQVAPKKKKKEKRSMPYAIRATKARRYVKQVQQDAQ
jgi:hypothetical protein